MSVLLLVSEQTGRPTCSRSYTSSPQGPQPVFRHITVGAALFSTRHGNPCVIVKDAAAARTGGSGADELLVHI